MGSCRRSPCTLVISVGGVTVIDVRLRPVTSLLSLTVTAQYCSFSRTLTYVGGIKIAAFVILCRLRKIPHGKFTTKN